MFDGVVPHGVLQLGNSRNPGNTAIVTVMPDSLSIGDVTFKPAAGHKLVWRFADTSIHVGSRVVEVSEKSIVFITAVRS